MRKDLYFSLIFFTLTLSSQPLFAQKKLDFSFIQGQGTNIPDILKHYEGNSPGEYLTDVYLNSQKYGRQKLIITENDKNKICLPKSWLNKLGLPINLSSMSAALDVEKKCYTFDLLKGGSAKFDYGRQLLILSLPQLYLLNENKNEKWDFGSPGFRLNYSVNGSKTLGHGDAENSESLYGSLDFNANYDRWVLSAKTSGTSSDGFNSPDVSLSTSIQPLRGDLIVGKSYSRVSMLPDFSFYGVSLRSNAAMVPWSVRGYAPVIDGVLNSNAKVTVKQDDYILFSKNLPAGPYSLKDLSPISNGDLTVIVEENNGTKTSTIYPVTTLPTLLRQDDFNYNFVAGVRDDDSQIDGAFGLVSADYGFSFGTTSIASLIHEQYQSLGAGLTLPIGDLGAVSASLNYAWSHYDNQAFQPRGDRVQQGLSATLQYAKDFGLNTNLQLLTYQYTGRGYEDFSSFNPENIHVDSDRRSRYEAIITQKFGSIYLNASGWYQDYRDGKGNDSGANLSLSSSIKNGMSLGLSGAYTSSDTNGDEYSTSLSVSIPFDFLNRSQFSTSSLNYDSLYGTSFNSGLSLSVSDDVRHNLNVNVAENDNWTTSLYTGVRFDLMQTGFSISQSDKYTVLAANASGSIAGVKGAGFAYSNQQNDTIAIARIQGLDDVKFNGSTPTNRWGNAIIPLNSYQKNKITIDTNNIPENIELLDDSFNVTPTGKAIIVRDFKYAKVKRYLLRIFDKDNQPFVMGTQVKTNSGLDVGFIAHGGVVIATLLSDAKYLKINDDGNECRVRISNVKPSTNHITELTCQ
ncbi:TPA: PefC/AfrB family outer membrane usher protein [Photobacterium damselae]